MKTGKRVLLVLLAVLVLLAAVFAAGRWGWKIAGFRACEDAAVMEVAVRDGEVRLRGACAGSFPTGFCGYYAEEENETLFVGFRFSPIFGIFSPADFDLTIPTKGRIECVEIRTGEQERVIWSRENAETGMPDPDAAAPETPEAPEESPEVTPETPEETPEAPEDAEPVSLPVLDEIAEQVQAGAAGCSLRAVQVAVKLLDWAAHTELTPAQITRATRAYLDAQDENARARFAENLALVESAYRSLLREDIQDTLESAGCMDVERSWGCEPLAPIEAILAAAAGETIPSA